MTRVDFYKLPRSVQERFCGSTSAQYPPLPILVRRGAPPTHFMWLGMSGVSALVLLLLYELGHGSLDSALSIHSIALLPVYILLFAAIVAGVVKAVAIVLHVRRLPFTPGVYAFPWSVIDARTHVFSVHDMSAALKVDGPDAAGGFTLTFPKGAAFAFATANPGAAQQAATQLAEARASVQKAIATEDDGAIGQLDPLHEPRFSSPVGPADPHALAVPPWAKRFWAVGLGAGVVVGGVLFFVRNSTSDNKMYQAANAVHDAASYRAYLVRGRSYRQPVTDILLPRAELRDAEKAGTVEAIQGYIKAHPSSKIPGEVQVSLRAALLAELEKAKAKQTLSALQEFAKKYPEHGLGPELKAATHAVYERGLEAYRKRAPDKEKDKDKDKERGTLAFVERLFAVGERLGPTVEVRFRRRDNGALRKADHTIGKNTYFMGEISYPSRYFDPAHWTPRETALGKAIVTRLGEGFDGELVALTVGEAVADQPQLPTVKVPTVFVSYAIDWQGHTYNNNNPRGIFVGLVYAYDVTFVLPDNQDKVWHFHQDVFRPAALQTLKDGDGNPIERKPKPPLEEVLYDEMSKEAADTFVNKLAGALFKK
jgi:hypothetical protein